MSVGNTVVVVPGGASADHADPTARRLVHQGLIPGATITVIRRTTGGGRLVGIGSSRVALDPAVARGVLVDTEVPGEGSL